MRDYDVIIFGATGYTGKWVTKEFSIFAENKSWAICGRSEERLKNVLYELDLKTDILVADISVSQEDFNGRFKSLLIDTASMDAICQKTQLMVNCTGPYRLLGEPILKSCVSNGTDYLDLCGEPEFIEAMEMKYQEAAGNSGSIVISGCGFDSIPSEIGINFLRDNFGGELHAVEGFLNINAPPDYCGHATTWDCAVMGIGNEDALRALRRIKPKTTVRYEGKSIKRRGFGEKIKDIPGVQGRAIPFPGSDVSIVRRSQALFHNNTSVVPVRYSMYALVQSVSSLLRVVIGGTMLKLLSKFSFGQHLLREFCQFFSFGAFTRDGPSKNAIERTSFTLDLVGNGMDQAQNQKQVKLRVSGPEPGYDATSKILIASVRALLEDREMILKNLNESGAVTTTAFAFNRTSLVEKLEERGISFEIIQI